MSTRILPPAIGSYLEILGKVVSSRPGAPAGSGCPANLGPGHSRPGPRLGCSEQAAPWWRAMELPHPPQSRTQEERAAQAGAHCHISQTPRRQGEESSYFGSQHISSAKHTYGNTRTQAQPCVPHCTLSLTQPHVFFPVSGTRPRSPCGQSAEAGSKALPTPCHTKG